MTDDNKALIKSPRITVPQDFGLDGSPIHRKLHERRSLPRLGDLSRITLELKGRPDPSPSKARAQQLGHENNSSSSHEAPLLVPPKLCSDSSESLRDGQGYETPAELQVSKGFVDQSDDSRVSFVSAQATRPPYHSTPDSSPPTPTKVPAIKLAANMSSRAAEALFRLQGQSIGVRSQIPTHNTNGPSSSVGTDGFCTRPSNPGTFNTSSTRIYHESGLRSAIRPAEVQISNTPSFVATPRNELDKAALLLCLQKAEPKLCPIEWSQAPRTPNHPPLGQTTILQAQSTPVYPHSAPKAAYPPRIPRVKPVAGSKNDKGVKVTNFVQVEALATGTSSGSFTRTPLSKGTSDAFLQANHSPFPRSNFDAVYGLYDKAPVIEDVDLKKLDRKLMKMKLFEDHSDRPVHIFIDMSNIFIGLEEKCREKRGIHKNQYFHINPKEFLFRRLHHILVRNRPVGKKSLAGSVANPAEQISPPAHFEEAKKLDYKTSMMLRVMKIDHSNNFRHVIGGITISPSAEWTASSGDESSDGSPTICPRTKLGEQGVDENLHLAMQSSLLDAAGPGIGSGPGVMVLATGDAKEAEFSEGFAHYAQKAMLMGWHVEVVSWKRCLSSIWKRSPFTDQFASQFRIIELDPFHEDMIAGKL